MKQTEKKKLEKWARKFFENDSKALDIFDFNSETDMSLTLEENKNILRGKIRDFLNIYNQEQIKQMSKKEAEIIPIEQHRELEQKEMDKIEEQAELEFNKALEKIENEKTTNLIEDVYYIPKQYTKMVAKGFARGFLLWGETGIGKTYAVIKAFREENVNFILLAGHITSLELYEFLFEHRKENIVLDDVNILENEQNLNMLKACLSDISRIVQYHTSSPRLKIPNKFLFEGTIILILNELPYKCENLKAVESRILSYELKLNYETKIKIIFELAKQPYKNLSLDDRQKITKWIRKNTNEATENLNLRLLFNLYEFYRFDKDNWQRLAEKIIQTDEYKLLIIQGIREKEWCEITGKHRATYYRLKQNVALSHT